MLHLNPAGYAGIDLGPDHLAAVSETSNQPGFTPLLVSGRPYKAIHQFYNKRRAELQARLPVGTAGSKRLNCLTGRRNRRPQHGLHLISRWMIDHLASEGRGTPVVGQNPG